MSRNKAKTNQEFNRRFDAGEDIHDLLDISEASFAKPGNSVRITLDMSRSMLQSMDRIRHRIGVDRSSLIKIWLHERVQQEEACPASLNHPKT
jgi:hypothetical protein